MRPIVRPETDRAAAVVRWHWEKAGSIEFVHDVTKNDLAAGLPPSGKSGANAAWYRFTLSTYSVLTVPRRQALPVRFRDARPKRLRYEVFTVPAEIRTHARQLRARLGGPPLTVNELVQARGRLRDLAHTLRVAPLPWSVLLRGLGAPTPAGEVLGPPHLARAGPCAPRPPRALLGIYSRPA